MKRRDFFQSSAVALAGAGFLGASAVPGRSEKAMLPTLSLNAYSFNAPLRSGTMTLSELFDFARLTGFTAVDLTAYYIPGYPDVPPDAELFGIRKAAFRSGLALSGTGVRNDFTVADSDLLQENIRLVKKWIVAASKLGAPHVRVFDGRTESGGRNREEVRDQVIRSFVQCADFGQQHGVMVAYQNHDDFIKSTDGIMEIMDAVDSEWFGLMLDIGSVNGTDPYAEIGKLIPHAITWQVKEQVKSGSGREPTDFHRLVRMVKEQGYRGFFPLETLGEGDPGKKVRALYGQVSSLLGI